MDGTILLMDYSSYERQKCRHIIEKTGSFNIVEVGGISQFMLVDLNRLNDLKLVIMDLMFPKETNGFDALGRIRSSGHTDVPVIIVTPSDKHELKAEALKYSVSDYIIKPYQILRLENSIRSLVRINRDFNYDTSQIGEIRLPFDEYIQREIKYSKRTGSPLSLILLTTLQLSSGSGAGQHPDQYKASVFAMAAKKSREALRATDTIVLNQDRDIIIVLPFTDKAGAALVCEKIKAQMEPEFEKISMEYNEHIYPVYVTLPEDGDSFQALMKKAFEKVSNKEMLEKIVSINTETYKYASKSYNRYNRLF